MSWRAIDELPPSFEATRGLAFPFDPWRWLVLAMIAFVVDRSVVLGSSGKCSSNWSEAIDLSQFTRRVRRRSTAGG